ncbi:MAG: hypothetical protein AB7G47_16135 [Mycolicibacterium sp.]|uniref:DUF6941 family protein n=1 Tax=Mycolicibacterium sp. TaxID=2320850 RepID=UPI003D0BBAD1
MLLTDAFLAVKAEFVDGRLNVQGGILGTMYVPPPVMGGLANARTGRVDLVTLVRTGPSDHQKPHRLTIEFIDADGNKQLVVEDTIVFDQPAEGSGCWVSPMMLANVKPGEVAFIVSVDGAGKPVRIPVQVRVQ